MSKYKINFKSYATFGHSSELEESKEKITNLICSKIKEEMSNFTTSTISNISDVKFKLAEPVTFTTTGDTTAYSTINYSFCFQPTLPVSFINISFVADSLVSITKENFNTHTWNESKCNNCGLYFETENGKLVANKNISCNENKFAKLLG